MTEKPQSKLLHSVVLYVKLKIIFSLESPMRISRVDTYTENKVLITTKALMG
jgi:hypothetical protein